jgi:hypothetical protein
VRSLMGAVGRHLRSERAFVATLAVTARVIADTEALATLAGSSDPSLPWDQLMATLHHIAASPAIEELRARFETASMLAAMEFPNCPLVARGIDSIGLALRKQCDQP